MELTEKRLGLTDAKPDFVFGLKEHRSQPKAALLKGEAKALIGVAPRLRQAFSVIETKGCEEPIQRAEMQAIRSSVTLVAARRLLNMNGTDSDQEKEGANTQSFAFSCS